jgi:hypothetical protein
MPPGSTSTSAAEMAVAAGNTLESVMRTVPLLVRIGFCAVMRWLNFFGTCSAPAARSALSGPGSGAGKI